MRIVQKIILAAIVLSVSGCAGLLDVPKTIWGSSARVLEDARVNALARTYEKGYWDCFKAALKIVNKKYVLFKKDEVRGYMVVMGIPGSVNTTEVGVFFVELGDNQTRIELSSLSTNAKRLLGKGLFHGMDIAFGLVPPDKQDGFSPMDFKNGQTPEALVKAIEDDGFSVPSQDDPIDALNEFLGDSKFYDNWRMKYKETVVSPEISKLADVKERNIDEIKLLNRLLLEQTYPAFCPVTNKESQAEGMTSKEPQPQAAVKTEVPSDVKPMEEQTVNTANATK